MPKASGDPSSGTFGNENMTLASAAHYLLLGSASVQAQPEGFFWYELGSFLGSLLIFVICLPPTLLAMWLGWTSDKSTIGKPYYDDVLFRGLIIPQPVWPWGYVYCAFFWIVVVFLLTLLVKLIASKFKIGRTGSSS